MNSQRAVNDIVVVGIVVFQGAVEDVVVAVVVIDVEIVSITTKQ